MAVLTSTMSGVRLRPLLVLTTAAFVFGFVWLLRFNDPGGSFAGLTDDHFFYLVRGWQILYGELPVRDFVDHGAPLYYYIAAAVQQLFGRGTLSELAFSVTMIALGGALTFWLAARASGSILLGLLAAAIQAWLTPRFYNYPKILVYAAAIPLLWWFADRPGRWPRLWLAVATALAFLFRHDHGAFVGISVVVLVLALSHLSWRERVRHLAIYVLLTCALLAPYLLFIQANGGLVPYLQQASAWAARDRDRAPVVWPGLFDYPDGVSPEAESGSAVTRAVAAVRDNTAAWWYYLELALPVLALGVLLMSADAFRPGWAHAGPKILVVAALGVVLNAGFLRSPLGARLADPSVPHAILIAWLAAAIPAMFCRRESWTPTLRRWRVRLASITLAAAAPFVFVVGATLTHNVYDRLDSAALVERPGKPFQQAAHVGRALRAGWQLATWRDRPDRPALITLAMYLNACTPSGARVFVQPYIPQVLALARRGFAGGHADLRPGFFATDEAQTLTLERLRRQHVPIALLETGDSYENFRESFPLITAYLDQQYTVAATHVFDERFGITLLLNRDEKPGGRFAPLDWPCLASAAGHEDAS